jgi:NAD(P)-dependent dehydrogenase (short-subunit alcohol dehydrogenase family)
MKTLEGKTAIVTGGGSGIGRCVALMLAGEGARVAVVGRRKEPLQQVVAEIDREKGIAVARTCDMTKSPEARELGAWAVKTFGGVDILINNAGESSHSRSIRWTPQEQWDSVINVNLTGVYALTQSVLQSMIDRGAGTVVTVASLAALRPGGLGGVAYGAAKAGARALMQATHTELHDLSGGSRHADPRQAPPRSRCDGALDDDASRGRCARNSPRVHDAAAHRHRGDHHLADVPA